jgi:L-amino acid N-acyltransferase YncA
MVQFIRTGFPRTGHIGRLVMQTELAIRMATVDDAEALLEIYAPYVRDTAITFEYDVPSSAEFAERMTNTLKKYPYLVALEKGRIAGYAYASAFRPRAAYNWSVETTVYCKQDCRGRGVGKALYRALEDALKRQNIINLYACIACAPAPDEHLDNGSISFHERMGYTIVGRFTKCGYKFGTWYDMVWMEKMIGTHRDQPTPFKPVDGRI